MGRYRQRPLSRPELADANWLREKYIDTGLTAQQIATTLGISKPTVLAHLRRHEIPLRPAARPRRVETDVLAAAYLAGESLSEVGRRFGLTPTGVHKALRAVGVPMRASGPHGKRRAAAWPQLMEDGWLEREYVQNGRHMSEIARSLGCCAPTVRRAIHVKGITPRHNARPTAVRAMSHRRRMQVKGAASACVLCSATEDLELHHHDADRSNDADDNLVVLCRDCHAIAEWLIRPVEARLRNQYSLEAGIA